MLKCTRSVLILVALLTTLSSFGAARADEMISRAVTVETRLETPSVVTAQYLDSTQKMAKLWVDTRPWPNSYREFLETMEVEFRPVLSVAALDELRSKPATGPKELSADDAQVAADQEEGYQALVDCVSKAHFTVLSESIDGERAKVEVETTVIDAFGSGKTESFQDELILVRENGRWVLTPEAFKTFTF